MTAESLHAWTARVYGRDSIIVLANREPIRHDYTANGRILARRCTGGLVTALEPLVSSSNGVWIAHGCGTADRDVVDVRDGVEIPADGGAYRLRRLWLSDREEQGYYYGFSNRALWPLCHCAHVQPVFDSADFECYRTVNARFADAVCEEAGSDTPLVLVQDYHLMLAPRMIRRRLPHATVVWFSHVPFPAPRQFAVCPWGGELLEGLLGSTVLGFQTPDDCRNFVETAAAAGAAAPVGADAVMCDARRTTVRAYPVSVEWPGRAAVDCPPVSDCRRSVREQIGCGSDVSLVVGIDRLDYTKGIEEKFLAAERLLESRPEFRGMFVLVQVADPSRSVLPAYQDVRRRVAAAAQRINGRFGTPQYQPIVLLETHHEPIDVSRLLRAADVCYVGSLHDGMNLVAKEFVAARDDERGVLVLSRFAGAALELKAALIVNPYAIEECAGALARALQMAPQDQAARMRLMRAIVAERNSYTWAGELLADAARARMQLLPTPDLRSAALCSYAGETGTYRSPSNTGSSPTVRAGAR